MAKFKLRWVADEKALSTDGAWHLVPLTPDAYEYAAKNLKADWVDGVQTMKSKSGRFSFSEPGK